MEERIGGRDGMLAISGEAKCIASGRLVGIDWCRTGGMDIGMSVRINRGCSKWL